MKYTIKVIILLLSYSALFTLPGFSQQDTLKALRDKEKKAIKDMKMEFLQYMKEQDSIYNEFVDKYEAQFHSFLINNWESKYGNPAEKPILQDKPDQLPTYKDTPRQNEDDVNGSCSIESMNKNQIVDSVDSDSTKRSLTFMFYDKPITIYCPKKYFNLTVQEINNIAIADFWLEVSGINDESFFQELNNNIEEMELNDWGIYLFLSQVADAITVKVNTNLLFTWYLCNKLGFDLRVGYDEKKLFLLLPSVHKIYHKKFITLGHHNFYLINDETDSCHVYTLGDYVKEKTI